MLAHSYRDVVVLLFVEVGLLKVATYSDDPMWARHLELQVGVVRDGHELGEVLSIEEGVVDSREVDHLEDEWLLVEVVRLAEGEVEPDAPKGHGFLSQHDPLELCLAGAQAAPRDAHLVKGAGVEYVEATAPSISTLVRCTVPTIGLTTSGKR